MCAPACSVVPVATLALLTLFCGVHRQAAASFMLCASAYAAAATAIGLGIAVALINVILVLSVLGGGVLSHASWRREILTSFLFV